MNSLATAARSWASCGALTVAFLLGCPGVARTQSEATIVRVEEDWELVVGQPAPTNNAPQVVTTISPLGHTESVYATLDLNHHPIPGFTPGGLQFEVWEGSVPLMERRFPDQSLLQHPGEVVRWTQAMTVGDHVLSFEVISGSSATWGSFGGQGYLKHTVFTTLDNLNAYSPEVSVANSGVGFAGNRVQSLILKRVRYFTSTGEQIEDATARVVHSDD